MIGQRAVELQLSYLRFHRLSDLDAAIEASREGLSTADTASRAAVHLSHLCNALRMRHEETGDERDLDEAIDAGHRAVAQPASSPRSTAQRLSNLAFACRLRYQLLGTPRDVIAACAFGRAAVDLIESDDPGRPLVESNLAVALRERYEVSGDVEDLKEAVRLGRRSLDSVEPADDVYRGILSNVAIAIVELYEAIGAPEHLQLGVALLRQTLTETPLDDPDRPRYAANLAVALLRTVDVGGSEDAVDEAIAYAEHACVLLPADHPELAGCLSDLGRAHRTRAARRSDPEEMRLAVELRRQASAVPSASPGTRALAARMWGEWAAEDGDTVTAFDGYATAVNLISRVLWHGLERSALDRLLRSWAGLPRAAASAALAAHRDDEAVRLLEEARTVSWNHRLDHHADRSALRTVVPDVMARLDALSVRLAR